MSWYNLTRKLHDKQLEASLYYVCSWCRKDKLQKGYFFLHLSENNSRSFKLHCIHSCYLYNVLSTQPNTRTTKGAKTVKCFILRNGSMALFIPFSCYWNMIKSLRRISTGSRKYYFRKSSTQMNEHVEHLKANFERYFKNVCEGFFHLISYYGSFC